MECFRNATKGIKEPQYFGNILVQNIVYLLLQEPFCFLFVSAW